MVYALMQQAVIRFASRSSSYIEGVGCCPRVFVFAFSRKSNYRVGFCENSMRKISKILFVVYEMLIRATGDSFLENIKSFFAQNRLFKKFSLYADIILDFL
jgi:hypothetical protein